MKSARATGMHPMKRQPGQSRVLTAGGTQSASGRDAAIDRRRKIIALTAKRLDAAQQPAAAREEDGGVHLRSR